MAIQGYDISWGGVRFSAPKLTLTVSDSITIKFPWANGGEFLAHAEVVRTKTLDDHRDMVAARFSGLSAGDQKRLEKLLEMLQDTPDENTKRATPLVPVLEVFVGDVEEMRAKLAELAKGYLSVTVVEVETYDVEHSIRVLLSDPTEQPPMRLRARVVSIESVPLGSDSAWPMFDVKLRLEHPLEELKLAARSRLKLLPKEYSPTYTPDSPEDNEPDMDNPYLS